MSAGVATAPNPCCRQGDNLTVIEQDDRVVVRRCAVCGCRHFRALLGELKPGHVGIGHAPAASNR